MENQVLKGSKYIVRLIFILTTLINIPCLIGIGIIIANLIEASNNDNELFSNVIALISVLLFVLVFIVTDIIVLMQYKNSRIILTPSKLVETYKDKIRVEILYSNVEKVILKNFVILIYCKDTFKKKGWNKGSKTFYANLSADDCVKIQKTIQEYNFNYNSNIIIER